MKQQTFLEGLQERVLNFVAIAHQHSSLSETALTERPDYKSWNVLECYEHLNRYGIPYLQYIEKAVMKGKVRKNQDAELRSAWLGGFSARSMETTDTGVKMPMSTFKSKNPLGSEVASTVIAQFIKQQEDLLPLIALASKLDLNASRCKVDLPLITFRLGDALAFYTNHIARHITQAERILKA